MFHKDSAATQRDLKKPETALVTQMRTGVPFYLPVSWQITAGSAIVATDPRNCGMSSANLIQLRRETWEDSQRKEAFGVIVEWGGMLTHPSYAKKKKAASFIKQT